MKTRNTEYNEATLESVQARFDHWRKSRQKREAIPEDLWSAAVELTETYSINKVASCLRLNGSSLKQRAGRSEPPTHTEVVKPSSFIEIPFIQSRHAAHCQVDIQRPDGSRMQIRMSQGGNTELPGLVRAFLG